MGKRGGKTGGERKAPVEAELRLAGEPAVLQALFASPCMTPEPGVEEKIVDLDSRYFDTSDLDLRTRGLAFRVRANGAGYKQTLKAGDDAMAAVLQRGEWETKLEDDRPRPDVLPKGARGHLPKSAFGDDLQEAFATKVRRQTRNVAVDDRSKIEAALDLGEITTAAGSLPIAEIELELLEGHPEALYQLALRLQEIGPVHLETRSKSARAFDRIEARPPRWHAAKTPRLSAADSVDDAMAAICGSCFAQWLANQAAAIDGRDPEGVHQMRVALRRLRSAFSVFGKMIPAEQLAWLKADAKQAIGALGPARDWDVFQADLLAPVMAGRPEDADLKALRAKARTRGKAGYRQARRHLASVEYTRFVLRFGQWLEQRAWHQGHDAERAARLAQPIADFAGKLLEKRYRQARARGKGFAKLPPAGRHQLRIALKKLRYTVEFFKPLFDKTEVKPFIAQVKALQDDLGHLNDVAVAETLLADLLARPGKQDLRAAAGLVIGWHARGVAMVEPELRQDWKSFKAAPALWRG